MLYSSFFFRAKDERRVAEAQVVKLTEELKSIKQGTAADVIVVVVVVFVLFFFVVVVVFLCCCCCYLSLSLSSPFFSHFRKSWLR